MEKKYRIFWSDDEYDKKVTSHLRYKKLLEDYGIDVKHFPNSSLMFEELTKTGVTKQVDGIIVDFNMSNHSTAPRGQEEQSGFIEVLNKMDKYVAEGIPFYLWSKMDLQTILERLENNPDYGRESAKFKNYFLDAENPRFFPGNDTLKETLIALTNEISSLERPEFHLRVKYPRAYEAAIAISSTCWTNIVNVMSLSPDSPHWEQMENLVNPLRCEVDNMFKYLGLKSYSKTKGKNGEDLESGISLGKFKNLVAGDKDYKYKLVSDTLLDENLAAGTKIFLDFVNDGSHQADTLKKEIRNYLIQQKDEHLLKFIAHAFINILTWAKKAKDYEEDFGQIWYEDESISKITDKNRKIENSNDKFLKDQTIEESEKDKKKQPKFIEKPIALEGILEADEEGNLHVGDCACGSLKLGDTVVAFKVNENTDHNPKYPKYAMFHPKKNEINPNEISTNLDISK